MFVERQRRTSGGLLFNSMNVFDRIGALPLRVLCSVLVGTVVVVFSSAFANTLELKAFQGLSERVSVIAAATAAMRWPGSARLPPFSSPRPCVFKCLLYVYGLSVLLTSADAHWQSRLACKATHNRQFHARRNCCRSAAASSMAPCPSNVVSIRVWHGGPSAGTSDSFADRRLAVTAPC